MLTFNHVLAVLSVLPLSLSIILQPVLASHLASPRRPSSSSGGYQLQPADQVNWTPRKRSDTGVRTKREPVIRVGGVELQIYRQQRVSRSGALRKRAGGNGSTIILGTTLDTYVIPISIGSPPTSYPLQLDLGSSDILLASTLCGKSCPASLGAADNPYYDVSRTSSTFIEVDGNQTSWNASFADGSLASGFVARESVAIGGAVIQGQVFGMINATNLTLADQQISGIIGLGFPRLSVLAHTLLAQSDMTSASASNVTSSASATSSSLSASSTSSSAYLPPLLESLFMTPQIPYPVFGLALSPPPTNTSTTPTSSAAPDPSSTTRYQTAIGALTLGGVSSLYVSSNSSSGRTVQDIEWWDVVPFGAPVLGLNLTASSNASTVANNATSNSTGNASSSVASIRSVPRAKSSASANPSSAEDLSEEQYLYWALNMKNVSMNGTDVGLSSTYASLGLGSIALLDAGSSGIYGPQQDLEKIFSMITDARQVTTGQWAVPCTTSATMGFSFGGRYVQLQPSDWMYASIASSSFCLAWPAAVPSIGDGVDWQLGTPFLKKVYSVFSYGINGVQAPLVGFLPLPEDAPTSTTISSATSAIMAVATNATSTTTNISTTDQPYGPTPTQIIPLTLTSTISITLPNAVFPNPTFATPPYAYSLGAALTPGVLQYGGLANASAYTVTQVPIITADEALTGGIPSGSSSGSSGSPAASSTRTSTAWSRISILDSRSLGFTLGLLAVVVLNS